MSHPSRETLAAYWLGELPEAAALTLEEHLFGCEACSVQSARMAALPRALAFAVPPLITSAESQRIQALDARIVLTRIPVGGRGVADFSSGVEAQLMVLEADLGGAQRVEVTMCTRDGTPLTPGQVAPFDAQTGTITIACRRYYVESGVFPLQVTMQVEAIAEGKRWPVGTFDIDHIPPV